MTSNKPYVAVLRDLEKSRQTLGADMARLQKQLNDLDQLMAALKQRMTLSSESDVDSSTENNAAPTTHITKTPAFVGMSMRWAILRLLGNHDTPIPVGQVADTLREGGFPNPEKIRGNAAAVLSRLVSLGEAENAGNRYTITDRGREALRNTRFPNVHVARQDLEPVGPITGSEGV